MSQKRFSSQGRTLLYDGVPVVTIHRVGDDSKGYSIAPWTTDRFMEALVPALNNAGLMPRFYKELDADVQESRNRFQEGA